jgi:hypothetical protein
MTTASNVFAAMRYPLKVVPEYMRTASRSSDEMRTPGQGQSLPPRLTARFELDGLGAGGGIMARWIVLAAGAAATAWLGATSPQSGVAGARSPSGGASAQPRVARPNVHGEACELEHLDRTRTSALVCTSCHDGTIGPGVEFRMGPDDGGMSHPVEVDYGAAYAKQPDKYVPPSELPENVLLVDGKVTCVSCHDPASTERNHVSRPASLCDACHRI